jgi:hypothetical protein
MAGSPGGGGAGSAVAGGIDDPRDVPFTTQADNESPMIDTNSRRFNMLLFLRAES